MKVSTALVIVPLALSLGAGAQAACVYPQAPQKLPNGASAAKEEMLVAQGEVKEYSKTVQETYLPCLEKEKNDAVGALDAADPEYAQKKESIETMHAKKHNAALDELQAVAAHWSEEIKAFNAQGKK